MKFVIWKNKKRSLFKEFIINLKIKLIKIAEIKKNNFMQNIKFREINKKLKKKKKKLLII